MNDLPHPDRGQVAVALIGKDDLIGPDGLDPVGKDGSAAVGGLDEVHVDILVHDDGTAHRGDADSIILDPQLVYGLADQAVGHAVHTTRAVVRVHVPLPGLRHLKNFRLAHLLAPSFYFFPSFPSSSLHLSSISCTDGVKPPHRP